MEHGDDLPTPVWGAALEPSRRLAGLRHKETFGGIKTQLLFLALTSLLSLSLAPCSPALPAPAIAVLSAQSTR